MSLPRVKLLLNNIQNQLESTLDHLSRKFFVSHCICYSLFNSDFSCISIWNKSLQNKDFLEDFS